MKEWKLLLLSTKYLCAQFVNSIDYLGEKRINGTSAIVWHVQNQVNLNFKLVIYVRGNKFIMQTGLQILCQSCSFILMNNVQIYEMITHNLITVLMIALRYSIESGSRQYFVAYQSQIQYENIIQDLLPSWVVIVKFDKNQGQLSLDKINSNMKAKLDIQDDKCFRDFLRKMKAIPYESERQSFQSIKLEHTLIRLLQQQKDEHAVERYYAEIDKNESKTKQLKFKITQVYFKTFDPSVILLFEELKEDKYESLIQQIEQRDYSQSTYARISLQVLTQQIQLLKFIKMYFSKGKSLQCPTHLLNCINNQIQKGYNIFNLNFDILNQFKISHRQIKFEAIEIQPLLLIEQLCEDLLLTQAQSNPKRRQIAISDVIKTDRAKLISIIINLVEYIKILMSIIYGDEKILSQSAPFGFQILISLKYSKAHPKCLKFGLFHPKLYLPASIKELFYNIETAIHHKKRNWNSKNYYSMINQLTHAYSQMFEGYKKDNYKSTSLMDEDLFPHIQKQSMCQSQESRLPTVQNHIPQQFQFNILGYPMAQYLISQLGPCNKLQFKNRFINYSGGTNLYMNSQQTKLSFLIYQNLDEFIQELNQQEKPIFEYFQKKKMFNHDITQKQYPCSQFGSNQGRF
ncbi:unnamed protein product (macronuclear) [Paramecium tetraurelia]|uniref:Chromosome undetermined scaffold_1, whole genome shotgun sequence n=1 Tax=Paramecium tetraurelia TaxID=5888 RepID=Q6BG40_PARTE|nr:hypothetical protein [Paramecium tetraurelia strain d4-2]XP_001423302.1 uncharacterized protein GSPATT00000339001 [Paramecium tetraurelia]CAH03380.1 hypothetical protein PTMB.183 [Paramecium tetraurelia]CAK55904.1 unnamed protein product [Paramecium tetraurelia]|eukprot:XP_001423302.1 hypothetical protein (macronuclear) [Paramecium tetraurelia strain d4-2]